jgi:hypothetical protein
MVLLEYIHSNIISLISALPEMSFYFEWGGVQNLI